MASEEGAEEVVAYGVESKGGAWEKKEVMVAMRRGVMVVVEGGLPEREDIVWRVFTSIGCRLYKTPTFYYFFCSYGPIKFYP